MGGVPGLRTPGLRTRQDPNRKEKRGSACFQALPLFFRFPCRPCLPLRGRCPVRTLGGRGRDMSFGQPRTSEQAGGDKQSWDRRRLLARRYAPSPTEQTKMVPCLRVTKGRPYGGMAVCGVCDAGFPLPSRPRCACRDTSPGGGGKGGPPRSPWPGPYGVDDILRRTGEDKPLPYRANQDGPVSTGDQRSPLRRKPTFPHKAKRGTRVLPASLVPACQKSPLWGFFDCASPPSILAEHKMLFSKSLGFQGFSSGGLLYSRRALPPRAPLLLCPLTFQRGFLTVSDEGRGFSPRPSSSQNSKLKTQNYSPPRLCSICSFT